MKSGCGNIEKFMARKYAMNYYFRKPPTTNPKIAHVYHIVGITNTPYYFYIIRGGGTCDNLGGPT